jgi:hypothetical protein
MSNNTDAVSSSSHGAFNFYGSRQPNPFNGDGRPPLGSSGTGCNLVHMLIGEYVKQEPGTLKVQGYPVDMVRC